MKKYLLLALLLASAPAARADDTKPVEAQKPVVVPFETLPTGHMTVMVKVNGKGPYKLIFDTGAPITLLNNKIAKNADLLRGLAPPLLPIFGTMGDVKVKELEVGGLKVADANAIVMDHPTVQAISDAFGPIEGIVGFPFFARFKMTLDYQAKTMTFVPNGYDPPDVMRSMQAAILATSDEPTILSASGVWGFTVDKKAGEEDEGVTVTKVLANGPAALAGLKEGDRLLTLGGRWTDSVADTFRAAVPFKPGTPAVAVVRRAGKEVRITIKPVSGL